MSAEDDLLEHFCALEDEDGNTTYVIALNVTERIRDSIIAICLQAGIDVADFIASGIAAVVAASEDPQGACIISAFPSKN